MQMRPLTKSYALTFPVLVMILAVVSITSIGLGAVSITLNEMYGGLQKTFFSHQELNLNERIFLEIRLPRVVLCILVGASLSLGGVLMQALFRNPIVEPGLIGTSSGAAFGAAFYFVLGATLKFNTGEWTLPLAACLGASCSTILVLIISRSKQTGKSSIVTLLLSGIAINALFLSAVGFLSYIARDPQARSITFWNMGTLSGANWHSVMIVGISTFTCFFIALRFAKHLNALMMGEEEAHYMGIHVKKLKVIILLINVILVAVATAFVGVISFVGLIVPHLLRILNGSDNRFLLLNSVLLGAILLCISDLAARLLLAPAELPIGIVTSAVGVPVFIILLRRKNYLF